MRQAVANMGQWSECNLADMKQVSQFTKANGPGILVWDFRAQLALPEQLSCNSVLCPSSYPMSQKHGYECRPYMWHMQWSPLCMQGCANTRMHKCRAALLAEHQISQALESGPWQGGSIRSWTSWTVRKPRHPMGGHSSDQQGLSASVACWMEISRWELPTRVLQVVRGRNPSVPNCDCVVSQWCEGRWRNPLHDRQANRGY